MQMKRVIGAVAAFLLINNVNAKSFEEKLQKKEEKMEKKMRKKEDKMEKKAFKHEKHLDEDRERIAEGEMPHHHEALENFKPASSSPQQDAAFEKKLQAYEQQRMQEHREKEEHKMEHHKEKEERKIAKKERKEKRKAEKKAFKHEKHLVKDRERIADGEMPEHHEAMEAGGVQAKPSAQEYKECVDYLDRRIQKKEYEQKKHAMKDQERIAKGEAPEHVGEASMTKDYTKDPKFDKERVCGPAPKEIQMQMLSEPVSSDLSLCGMVFVAVLASVGAFSIALIKRSEPSPAEEALLACEA